MQTVRGTACDLHRWRGCTKLPRVLPATCPVGKFLEGLTFLGIFVEWLMERVRDHCYITSSVPSTVGWVYYDISYKKLSIGNINF